MAGIRRSGSLVVVLSLAAASLLTAGAQSAGAGAANATVPWLSLIHSERAALIAQESGRSTSAIPRLPAAPQPSVVVHDPIGDIKYPQADIKSVGYGHNANGFVFSLNIVSPVNPKTDAAWLDGEAFAGWALDTNGDGQPEFIVLMVNDGAGHVFAGLLADDPSNPGCNGTAVYTPGVGYKAVFSPTCGSRIHHFRLQAATSYSTNPNDPNPPLDLAPDTGWSKTLSLSVTHSGYWLLGSDGQVHGFGLAKAFSGKVFGAVAIDVKRDGSGYWIVDRAGGVHAFGSATFHGGSPLLQPGEQITASAPTPSGNGYWLFSNLGRAFVYGDAHSFGDASAMHLHGPIIAAAATPNGAGYYLLGSDGGVFTFGDAQFHGSLGAKPLNGAIVDIAAAPTGGGYWIFAADGGVFSFHAPFRGSLGGETLNQPITTGTAIGNGYLMAASDGGVFNFSTQPFAGSLAGKTAGSRIIDTAAITR